MAGARNTVNAVIGAYTVSSTFGSTALYLVAVSSSGQNVPSRSRDQTVHSSMQVSTRKISSGTSSRCFEKGSYGIADKAVITEGNIVALQNQDAFRALLFALTELGTLCVERPLYCASPVASSRSCGANRRNEQASIGL